MRWVALVSRAFKRVGSTLDFIEIMLNITLFFIFSSLMIELGNIIFCSGTLRLFYVHWYNASDLVDSSSPLIKKNSKKGVVIGLCVSRLLSRVQVMYYISLHGRDSVSCDNDLLGRVKNTAGNAQGQGAIVEPICSNLNSLTCDLI